MFAHASHWLTILTCAVVVHGQGPGPSRDERKRSAVFNRVATGHKLSGHVIATHDVTSSLECADACLSTSGCKSYNYQEAGSPLHVCQLSNQSKSSASSSDYVIQAGFSYYDAEQYVLPGCSSSSCKNGGTCQIAGCTSDYVCQCTDDYSGENCETYTGLGSSSARPGHSCLYIKKYGKARGDGDYWIDPTRSGNPFLVKCDMTTDGGGWTIVRNGTLVSSNPSGYQTMPDYKYMHELDWYKIIDSSMLLNLRNDMGFNQMRYYCHKKSVGRTIHVMTAMNSLGLDAIRYLTKSSATPATACGSFIALPDDTSIISKSCESLGYRSNNVPYLNRWGHNICCSGSNRLFTRVFNYPSQDSQPQLAFHFLGSKCYCDDFQKDNLQPGDQWFLFVR